MASKKASSGQTDVKKLFAEAAQSNDASAWDRAKQALVNAIGAAGSEGEIEKLLRSPGVCEGFVGEADAWPEVAEALVRRASSLEPKDGARVLGWAARGSAFLPTAIVRPDLDPALGNGRKPGFAAAVDGQIEVFRQWLSDSAPERRSAGAWLLGWATSAKRDDLMALLVQSGKEKNAGALASELFALGVLAQRLGAEKDRKAIVERASGGIGNKNALVRLSAAVTLAFAGETLSGKSLDALLEHVTKPAALPAEWGFHAAVPPAMKSDQIACAVLCWAKVDDAEAAVRALLGKDLAKQPLGFAQLVALALANLSYAARGRPRPRIAVASELDPLEREVIGAFASGSLSRPGLAAPFGLPATNEIGRLLAGEGLDYRPIPLEVGGQTRRYHFAALWAAVLFQEAGVEVARDALLSAVSPREAVELVTVATAARQPVYALIKSDDEWSRDQDFSLAVLEGVRKAGFDLLPAYRSYATTRGALPGILALSYLKERPGAIPEQDVPLIASGVSAARVAEPWRTLLASLPEASRKAVLHAAAKQVGGNVLRVLDLCLDEVIVPKLVLFASGAWAAQYRDATLAILARGDQKTIELLQAFRPPGDAPNPAAEQVVKDAIAAIRARLAS